MGVRSDPRARPRGLKHLYRRLACDPAFFSEMILLIFRADTEEAPADPDPVLVRYAEHALHLPKAERRLATSASATSSGMPRRVRTAYILMRRCAR